MHIGTMLAGVGGIHVGVAGILYGTPLTAILREGLVDSVPDFGDRATAFWFTMTGLVIILLGACIRDVERRGSPLPAPLVPGLIALTLAFVVPMPISGAWMFAPIAFVAHRRTNASRPSSDSSAPRGTAAPDPA